MALKIIQKDITVMPVDAIVNAANKSLLGGGGVDGCIHRAAGKGLLEECRGLNGCETGEAKITGAYNLPCRHVIHTVGPVYSASKADWCRQKLTDCYRNSMELAKANNCKTIAFPLISAGVYGYPHEEAMQIAVETITENLTDDMEAYIIAFGDSMVNLAKRLYPDITE